jgi:uncharacterized protein YggE
LLIADGYWLVQPVVMKLFLFALLSLPISVLAEGGLPNQPYIYVEGKAEIQKPADIVTLRFDLVARAPDQPKANEEVQAKAVKIFGLLNNRKIAESDVIAENLRSEPEFQQDENYPRNRGKLIGYSVTRPFAVKVRDATAFPKLVDELIAIGGVEFSGIDGGLSKEKDLQNQVWEKSLSDARERAEKTVKALGMKIDSVFAVSPVAFSEIYQRIFGSEEVAGVRALPAASGTPQAIASEYRLGPVTISQSVHVIYLISPAK